MKMFKVNCIIEPHYPVATKFLRSSVHKILDLLKMKSNTEVSVSIIGDRKMKLLNTQFASTTETTDVLSFSQIETMPASNFVDSVSSKYLYIGDIAISYPQAIKNAIKDEDLVDTAIQKLLVHGLLHLLGYDHQTPSDEMYMKKLHNNIMKELMVEEGV